MKPFMVGPPASLMRMAPPALSAVTQMLPSAASLVEFRNPQRIDPDNVILIAAAELDLGEVLGIARCAGEVHMTAGLLQKIIDLHLEIPAAPGEHIDRPLEGCRPCRAAERQVSAECRGSTSHDRGLQELSSRIRPV